jgi:hypothetical protein
MKIINPEIIEKEEQRLLLSISDSLDLDAIREMFEKESGFEPIEKTKIQSSSIIVFGSQVVFKLQFEAPVKFSLLIDRLGNYLEMDNQNHDTDEKPAIRESPKYLANPEIIQKSEKEIIEKIAASLQKEQIKELFEQKFNFNLDGEIQFRNGNMLIHQSSITYKLNYDALLRFELMLDRSGKYLTPNAADKISSEDIQTQYSGAVTTGQY